MYAAEILNSFWFLKSCGRSVIIVVINRTNFRVIVAAFNWTVTTTSSVHHEKSQTNEQSTEGKKKRADCQRRKCVLAITTQDCIRFFPCCFEKATRATEGGRKKRMGEGGEIFAVRIVYVEKGEENEIIKQEEKGRTRL